MPPSSLHWEETPRYTWWGRRNHRPAQALALLVGAVVIGYTAWLTLDIQRAGKSAQALRLQTQEARSAMMAKSARATTPVPAAVRTGGGQGLVAGTGLTQEQINALNGVIRQLNIPWHDLFEQLERSTPAEVALLSIEPDGQRAVVKMQAEAKTLDALLRYAASLQKQGVFGRLSYSKHETNDQDVNRPVRLSFELTLLTPPRLSERRP